MCVYMCVFVRSSNLGTLSVPSFKTKSHGRYSFIVNATYTWNNIQKQLKSNTLLFKLNPNKIKTTLKNFYLQDYT
mgnify:CR=1 FL=1